MRNGIPTQISVFSRALCLACNSIRILAVAILLYVSLNSTSSLAARHKQAPSPSPSPSPITEILQNNSEGITPTPFLIFALVLVVAWAFTVKRRNDVFAIRHDELQDKIRLLKADSDKDKRRETQHGKEILALKNEIEQKSSLIFERGQNLSINQKEITALKSRIQKMIEVEPEIERKVEEIAKARAKAELEKKEKEEAARLQMELEIEGQERIESLMSSMKRGY